MTRAEALRYALDWLRAWPALPLASRSYRETRAAVVAVLEEMLREVEDRPIEEGLARVYPGCHAVAPDRCAPGCIDAEIEAEHRHAIESGDHDRSEEE